MTRLQITPDELPGMETLNMYAKRVLLRVDFNVPLKDRKVANDKRMRESLPTLKHLLEQRSKVVLCSHLGRPKGKDESLSMAPVADHLETLIDKKVWFEDDCVGDDVMAAVKKMKPGEIVVLENVRFHPEEEKGDEAFAKKLAATAELYVNDAFGTAHRPHASTTIVAKFLPSAAGFLVKKEVESLSRLLGQPGKPYVVVLGGAKVSDKVQVLKNLLDDVGKIDALLVGGGMAFTFLAAEGAQVGASLVEKEMIDTAREILGSCRSRGVEVHLPLDALAAPGPEVPGDARVVDARKVPPKLKGLDIGPETVKDFSKALEGAKTVFWNGPMGVFEVKSFRKGTDEIARAIAAATKDGAFTVVGGGDSVRAVEDLKIESEFSHVSTGGGASLEFLAEGTLPGLEALRKKA
ncbi:MAG TPA: phosphoglycerate kinase [Thermoplasmata archaeon]|nr:phosphoglycerate kinase [Thermoplasmata archaeon]